MAEQCDPRELPAGSFQYTVRHPAPDESVSLDKRVAEVRRRMGSGEMGRSEGIWELVEAYKCDGAYVEIEACMGELLGGVCDKVDSSKCHYILGCLSEKKRDYAIAVVHYRQALLGDPEGSGYAYWIHNNLGYSLNTLGHYAEGEERCRQAIGIDPMTANAYKNLALSLIGQGRLEEAIRNLVTATKANAADPRSMSLLEELCELHPELVCDNFELQALIADCRTCHEAYNEWEKQWN